jgi:sulfur-carrier protein
VKALYFAWVRERIGLAEEEIAPPPSVTTVGELIAWLKRRGDNYAAAFTDELAVRAALDRRHVKPEQPIALAKEIAFFPPMTGG